MAVRIGAVESTELFVGVEVRPAQVVRVALSGLTGELPVTVRVVGVGLYCPAPASVVARPATEADPLASTIEVGVRANRAAVGARIPGRVIVSLDGSTGVDDLVAEFTLTVAEPGWTMHMISHFHYDPVWWNTQAAYTSEWDAMDFPGSPRGAAQQSAFDLVKAHLALALRDEEYKFVLAEVDYLKPYWDHFPEDRRLLRRLISQGRIEIVGGMYNEPNTNLTGAEATIRNLVLGIGFQRHVLGGNPATAWQLDAYGHDPSFPGLAADAGLSSTSWARGPFHQWGPTARRDGGPGDPRRTRFRSEFEWISPSGRGLLTAYLPGHYSAGWGMDSLNSLEQAMEDTYQLFLGLKAVSATRDVLLPVGDDHTPPNKWITRIHREWTRRYVWPRFVCGLPKEFFAAVRAELSERGVAASPQTRDMNPIHTGKGVTHIESKQALRETEFALLDAERFAVFAGVLTGAAYPDAALAKAWSLLVYGTHHDAAAGSVSDQVHVDLLGGGREAHALATGVRDAALRELTRRVRPAGQRSPAAPCLVVWNPLTCDRTDVVRLRLDEPVGSAIEVRDAEGRVLPAVLECDGLVVGFVAEEVPSLGWRGYQLCPIRGDDSWQAVPGSVIANERFRLTVDPARGGGVSSLIHDGQELITEGRVGNELALYADYPGHPTSGEGPRQPPPRGPVVSSAETGATVRVWRSRVGERVEVTGRLGGFSYHQVITLWAGINRVEMSTSIPDFTGSDQLVRVRWPCDVPGGLPVSEVGDAVIGRGFAMVDVDAARHPWSRDNPAYGWFGLSTTVTVRIGSLTHPVSVAEMVVPDERDAAPLGRRLVVALASSGVTATCGSAHGPRCGDPEVDSNPPDTRISVGGPEVNAFTAAVLAAADSRHTDELERQLVETGRAMVWVPPRIPLREVWVPGADLRDVRALPVLIIAGADASALDAAIDQLVVDLDSHEIIVKERPRGAADPPRRTVALLNRGLPGFGVTTDGTLHLSLLRSCTGWPSGTWINPPRRTAPDGSGFQLRHWHHDFEYALVAGAGDWRDAEVPLASAAYGRRLRPVPQGEPAAETLGASGSLLRVEPVDRVTLAALKVAGNPLTRGSAEDVAPGRRIALRLVELKGHFSTARVSSSVMRLANAARADLLEQPGEPLPLGEGELELPMSAFDVATVLASPDVATSWLDGGVLGPEAEPFSPLSSRYWLYNTGPAPLGGLPAVVSLSPRTTRMTPGQRRIWRLSVAANRMDGPLRGEVDIEVAPGWTAEPARVAYDLAPGGYLAADVIVTAGPGVGVRPVRARLIPEADGLPASWAQPVEDVAVAVVGAGSSELASLVDGPEAVRLAPGETGVLSVVIAGHGPMDLTAEARVISPWGTWGMLGPWARGVVVPADGRVRVDFDVTVPRWQRPGRWWALVKVGVGGRALYSPSVPIEVSTDV